MVTTTNAAVVEMGLGGRTGGTTMGTKPGKITGRSKWDTPRSEGSGLGVTAGKKVTMIPDCHRSRGRLARKDMFNDQSSPRRGDDDKKDEESWDGPEHAWAEEQGYGKEEEPPRDRSPETLPRRYPGEQRKRAHRQRHPTVKAKRTPRVQRWRRKDSYSGKGVTRCSFTSYFQGIVR